MLEQVTIKFPLWSQLDLDKILKNRNKKQFFLENDLITEPSVHWLYFDRYTSNLPYIGLLHDAKHFSCFTFLFLPFKFWWTYYENLSFRFKQNDCQLSSVLIKAKQKKKLTILHDLRTSVSTLDTASFAQ